MSRFHRAVEDGVAVLKRQRFHESSRPKNAHGHRCFREAQAPDPRSRYARAACIGVSLPIAQAACRDSDDSSSEFDDGADACMLVPFKLAIKPTRRLCSEIPKAPGCPVLVDRRLLGLSFGERPSAAARLGTGGAAAPANLAARYRAPRFAPRIRGRTRPEHGGRRLPRVARESPPGTARRRCP